MKKDKYMRMFLHLWRDPKRRKEGLCSREDNYVWKRLIQWLWTLNRGMSQGSIESRCVIETNNKRNTKYTEKDEHKYLNIKSFWNNNTTSEIQLDKENKNKRIYKKMSTKKDTGNEKQMGKNSDIIKKI